MCMAVTGCMIRLYVHVRILVGGGKCEGVREGLFEMHNLEKYKENLKHGSI